MILMRDILVSIFTFFLFFIGFLGLIYSIRGA